MSERSIRAGKSSTRDHCRVTRALRILSVALITAGMVVLIDVAITLAWKEPVSSLYGSIQQARLADELAQVEDEFAAGLDLRRIERAEGVAAKARVLADSFADGAEIGQALGRVRIPEIDSDYVLVEGADTSGLQRGPAHYLDTRFPGQGGTVGIAGHRTTYLAPFRHLDEVQRGDEVVLDMPYASFLYQVQKVRVVEPTAIRVVRNIDYERAVLTACHPLYSAAKRLAVFARLERVSLFAASERPWPDP
jgi:sortase A